MKRSSVFRAADDQPLVVIKKDLGGGMNNRQHPQIIADNQAVLLQNIMLETAGQTSIRTGQTLVDSNFPPAWMLDDSGNVRYDDSGNPMLGS